MESQTNLERDEKKKEPFFVWNPNMTVIIYSTAIVILAASIILPFWFKYDPILQMIHDIQGLKHKGDIPLFTKEELAKYGAKVSEGKIYLAILGRVFDVSAGKQHYGKDGSYSFFTGVDGSKAFVSGDFNKAGLIDDLEGIKDEDCLALSEWAKFYDDEYKYVGNVIGNFYDNVGGETKALKDFQEKVKKAQHSKEKDKEVKIRFPDCNSKWSKEEGTELWCSNESGGTKRDWVGVPRMFFKPGQTDYRCACVNEKDLRDSRLRQYSGCGVSAVSCKLAS